MGERRKRKSAWEEDDTEHLSGMSEHSSWTGKDRRSSHDSRHYHEVSESRTSGTRKPRDNSGWPAWESIEEHPIAPMNNSFKNSQDGKEFGGGKRYYKNMSPGFDGMELRNYKDTHEYDQSHSQRYPGRGRSRSRSRSRSLSRGRERERRRSRSLSRGRERERRRSRSRIRNDVKAKDYTRIQSPINARQSYEWSDRRGGGPEKSSQICRDFSAGNCRRGSQCRFFHPNTMSRRDRDLLEDEPRESWRSRTDHNRVPKHSYSSRASSGFESRNDVSDPYHEDRRTVPCKDFLKGKCLWGDTCRFSHHAASDDGYGQGTGNASFDKGKNGKPFCKFFAAGKCSKENCRFSHDDPNNDRRGVVTTDRRSHDKSNWWDGPTWDDAIKTSDTLMPFCDSGNGQIDDRGDGSWENENKNWGRTESTLPRESGNYGGNTGFAEPIAKENTDNKQEHLIFYGSELQDNDGIENVDGEKALQENQSLSVVVLQQNIYPASQIQQQQFRVIENDQMNSFGSDVRDEVKETTTHSIPCSGHQNVGSIFPGHSSISIESSRGQNMLLPNNPSNGFFTDLNETNTDIVDPLNVQTHTQTDQKASQSPGFLEAKVPELLASLLTKKLSDQATKSPVTTAGQHVSPVTHPVSLSRSFVNENPQTYPEMLSFPDTSGWVPLVNTSSVQPNQGAVSIDLNSMGNCRENAEHGNLNSAQGTEPNNQIPLKQSSPLSVLGSGFDSSKARQEDVVVNSEVTGGNKVVGDESKGVEENKCSETQDGHEKIDEGGANKDEKGMRLFKNNLVEFVKEILKPTWKEGRMSREDHKTLVRKVVDKVSSTIQVEHIPKTQEKVDQYLACSKPKITKLVQAYVDRSLKKDS